MGIGVANMDFDAAGNQLSLYKTWPEWSIADYRILILCAADGSMPDEIVSSEEENVSGG